MAIAKDVLNSLLAKYQDGSVDAAQLASGLQQIYWNTKFDNEEEKERFFEAFFEIEQVVASHIGELDRLDQGNLAIIDRSIEIIRSMELR